MRSIVSKIEKSLQDGDIVDAVNLYKTVPGIFYRNLDRLLRMEDVPEQLIMNAVGQTASKVPARILFGIREHLQNRGNISSKRIFTNTKGKSWVAGENRAPLSSDLVDKVNDIIDAELITRLPAISRLVIDPIMLNVALPKSNKGLESGIGMMPRGSKTPVCVNGENLRFFMYWKEKEERTDYDLSVQFLNDDFTSAGHCSYTNLGGRGYVHSGDITSAIDGASEFIDIDLSEIKGNFVVPQVLVFSGESFEEVEESFFGFMERNPEDKGLPYEPATVRVKSDIRGVGKIALPVIFAKEDNQWFAYWMQMYLKGQPRFNIVENKVTPTMLTKAIVDREYLYVSYIAYLFQSNGTEVIIGDDISSADMYIGLNTPVTPKETVAYTLSNLHEIVDLFERK